MSAQEGRAGERGLEQRTDDGAGRVVAGVGKSCSGAFVNVGRAHTVIGTSSDGKEEGDESSGKGDRGASHCANGVGVGVELHCGRVSTAQTR